MTEDNIKKLQEELMWAMFEGIITDSEYEYSIDQLKLLNKNIEGEI